MVRSAKTFNELIYKQVKYRKNCWEYFKCGREPGGNRVEESGLCPASISERYDGLNHGKNAGRVCWSVSGTLCEVGAKGTNAKKKHTCMTCAFFIRVREQEGEGFTLISPSSYASL